MFKLIGSLADLVALIYWLTGHNTPSYLLPVVIHYLYDFISFAQKTNHSDRGWLAVASQHKQSVLDCVITQWVFRPKVTPHTPQFCHTKLSRPFNNNTHSLLMYNIQICSNAITTYSPVLSDNTVNTSK